MDPNNRTKYPSLRVHNISSPPLYSTDTSLFTILGKRLLQNASLSLSIVIYDIGSSMLPNTFSLLHRQ